MDNNFEKGKLTVEVTDEIKLFLKTKENAESKNFNSDS